MEFQVLNQTERHDSSELHDMHACLTKQQLLNLLYYMKRLVKNI